MLKVKLTDGSELEVQREEVHSILPLSKMLRHPHLNSTGLFYHCGKVVPVAGPFEEEAFASNEALPAEKRSWILFLGNHAYVISGFPIFDDDVKLSKVRTEKTNVVELPVAESTVIETSMDISEEERVLKEMEELLKSA